MIPSEEKDHIGAFEVLKFSTFADILKFLRASESAASRVQCDYLTHYLSDVGARTVVIENNYIDRGYVLDYVNYYARCHSPYEKKTVRLHFFSHDFDRTGFEKLLCGAYENFAQFQSHYLGYCVIKPLPITIIGQTCLKTYGSDHPSSEVERVYRVTRTYQVSLFGQKLEVVSVAFQEQDSEVAACSSCAIWYCLHGSEARFTVNKIPSPFEITTAARNYYAGRSNTESARSFPTSGLGPSQIEGYLNAQGWDCLVSGANELRPNQSITIEATRNNLYGYIHAYVSAGLPMIIVANLWVKNINGTLILSGLHAVTVVGYSKPVLMNEGNQSYAVSKIYVHDDNMGPFCSYTAEHLDLEIKGTNKTVFALSTSIGKKKRYLVPEYFIVPLDPKIRFPYDIIHQFAEFVNVTYESRIADGLASNEKVAKIAWNVSLMAVKDWKNEISRSETLTDKIKLENLLFDMPRYIWRLLFKLPIRDENDGELIDWVPGIEFTFDATEIIQGPALLTIISHSVSENLINTRNRIPQRLLNLLHGNRNTSPQSLEPILRAIKEMLATEVPAVSTPE